jgi:hypothetical protein
MQGLNYIDKQDEIGDKDGQSPPQFLVTGIPGFYLVARQNKSILIAAVFASIVSNSVVFIGGQYKQVNAKR